MRGCPAYAWGAVEGEEEGTESGFVCADWVEQRSSWGEVGAENDQSDRCSAHVRRVGCVRRRRGEEEVGGRPSY